MKKSRLIFILIIVFILSGCSSKSVINVEKDYIYLRSQDLYQIEATHSLGQDLTYKATNEIASVSKEGLVTALSLGKCEIIISSKKTITKKIIIEVVEPKELRVHFIDVGQADSILAILPNDEALLIDCGLDHYSTRDDASYPSWNNIKLAIDGEEVSTINHLIITHNHSDHYYYLPSILNNYQVNNIYSSGSTRTNSQYLNILKAIKKAGLVIQTVKEKDFIIDEGYLQLQVVTTLVVKETEDINYSSVMAKLTYYNRSFMFTGDAGYSYGDGEGRALASGINLQSDVLKVGHHGSKNSSGNPFLKAVNPQYAIITTAKLTMTGHPHEPALNRLRQYAKTILETKDYGTITFYTDGFDLTYTTSKQP